MVSSDPARADHAAGRVLDRADPSRYLGLLLAASSPGSPASRCPRSRTTRSSGSSCRASSTSAPCASSTRRIPIAPSSLPARRGSWPCSGATRCSPRSWRCRSTRRSPSARCARSPTCRARESTPPPRSSRDASSTRCGSAPRPTSPSAASSVYYGTADATPLFVVVLGELRRWGGLPDDATTSSRPPTARSSGSYDYGDRDGDGFVEYARLNSTGSSTRAGRTHGTASPSPTDRSPRAPDRALRGAGLRLRGVPRACRARGRRAATRDRGVLERARRASLKREFNERFWLPDRGYFALALDADKRPVDSCASNMGHCLWTRDRRRRQGRGRRRAPALGPSSSPAGASARSPPTWVHTTRRATTTARCGRTTTRSWPPA